jgi:hypothetical protein
VEGDVWANSWLLSVESYGLVQQGRGTAFDIFLLSQRLVSDFRGSWAKLALWPDHRAAEYRHCPSTAYSLNKVSLIKVAHLSSLSTSLTSETLSTASTIS